ncbi:MAG: DUF3341 domain-containing protein [Phycisphaeraceae bacterium]|nr:DUF3341 domain-containing protein [Phycisphaeraceae bacterium]MCW5767365.1 DUF3341 domain-containing protein [Phycisphaeraceae bacterium]
MNLSLPFTLNDIADYFPFLKRKPGRFVTPSGAEVHAIIAQFATPADVYHAAEKVRDAGYTRWDVHTPFPIHGLEEAMGIKRTILPLIAGSVGLGGAAVGFLLQLFISTDYEIVVQGKPFTAWEPFTPVTFELGILHCAFATLIGMLALNGLPRWHHPIFNSKRFLKSSDDGFFIAIEAADAKFEPNAVKALLESAGGTGIELVES